MSEPDVEAYKAFLEDVNRREISNSETYDNALLTLSSALLGLSLTFTGDLVPLNEAVALWVLYGAWAALTLTIILTINSFIHGQEAIRELKAGAKAYFLDGKKSINRKSVEISNRIHLLNKSTGVTFIAGVVLLGLYVGVNVHRRSQMPKQDQQMQVPDKKSQPLPTFDQTPPTVLPVKPQAKPEPPPQKPREGGEQKK